MADHESPTSPGWKPPQKHRVSDRLLIAILTAAMALIEAWHTISPARASEDSAMVSRVERVEADVGKLREAVGRIEGRLDRR